MSWIERGAGAVQELFYRLVQVSRDRHDGAICVGSCAIYRRDALETNGGTTLIEHSEDVHTGFDLRRAGWGLRYIPLPLATGLCPADPDSFLTQQYRWCAGSMSLVGSRKFWDTPMRWRTRCCYLSGILLLRAHCTFHLRRATDPAHHAGVPAGEGAADQLHIHSAGFPLQPDRLPGLAPLPVRAIRADGEAALRMVARVRDLGVLLQQASYGLAADRPGSARKSRTQRVWTGIVRCGTAAPSAAWVLLAVWRMTRFGPSFIPLLASGLLACAITAMALGARRNHVRVIGGAS